MQGRSSVVISSHTCARAASRSSFSAVSRSASCDATRLSNERTSVKPSRRGPGSTAASTVEATSSSPKRKPDGPPFWGSCRLSRRKSTGGPPSLTGSTRARHTARSSPVRGRGAVLSTCMQGPGSPTKTRARHTASRLHIRQAALPWRTGARQSAVVSTCMQGRSSVVISGHTLEDRRQAERAGACLARRITRGVVAQRAHQAQDVPTPMQVRRDWRLREANRAAYRLRRRQARARTARTTSQSTGTSGEARWMR